MQYQDYLPGFAPPGFTTPELLQRLSEAERETKLRLHNREMKGVRAPRSDDLNQHFWVWLNDLVPSPEGPERTRWHIIRRKHRQRFLEHLKFLASEGVIEMGGVRPWYRFRLRQ